MNFGFSTSQGKDIKLNKKISWMLKIEFNRGVSITFRLRRSTDHPCVRSDGSLHCIISGEDKQQTNESVTLRIPPFQASISTREEEEQETFGIQELDDEIVLEDVDLLDSGDGVDPYSLERALEPLVVRGGGLVDSLLLPEEERGKFISHRHRR
jgi:hypothetical protein